MDQKKGRSQKTKIGHGGGFLKKKSMTNKRSFEKYKVIKAKTERYKSSAVLNIQRMLNEEEEFVFQLFDKNLFF